MGEREVGHVCDAERVKREWAAALVELEALDVAEGAEFGRNAHGADFSRDDVRLASELSGPIYQAAALAAYDEARR